MSIIEKISPEPRELRALEIFDHVPAGCELALVRNGYNAPHLRTGEFAVIDREDVAFVSGEVYEIYGGKDQFGNEHRIVCQVKLHTMADGQGGSFEGVWFLPLCGPKMLPNGETKLNDAAFLASGPLDPACLSEYLKGRVVGVYQAPRNDPAPLRMIGNGSAQ